MGKPSKLFTWATTTNYTGGPAVGTATRVDPTSGAGSQQAEGLRPGDKWGAQLLGALFGNVFDWLAYVTANQVDGSFVIGGAATTFTAFTFTATNGTPGQLNATAHGLQTGDGPVHATNSGGGLPGGLVNGTDYWVIRVDADHFQLATSVADALAGAPVVITSNGTGSQTLSPGTSPTRLGDETVTRGLTVGGTASIGRKLTVGGQALSVPSFTFTANSGTDQLTATDHGLLNGDGPIQVSNSGGALPAGLAAATNYWVIYVDTANIKLATSYANALTGTAIDLTTNGTGTQTLTCTASTARPADAEVTGSLVVDGSMKQGVPRTYFISAAAFQAMLAHDAVGASPPYTIRDSAGFDPLNSGANQSTWAFTNTTGPASQGIAYSLGAIASPGKTIQSVTFIYDKNGDTGTMVFSLRKHPAFTTTAGTTIATVSDATSLVSRKTSVLSPNYQVETDFFVDLYVQQGASTSSEIFYGVKLVILD